MLVGGPGGGALAGQRQGHAEAVWEPGNGGGRARNVLVTTDIRLKIYECRIIHIYGVMPKWSGLQKMYFKKGLKGCKQLSSNMLFIYIYVYD